MHDSALPTPEDFFPRRRRGHGSGLGKRRPGLANTHVVKRQACVSCKGDKCFEPGNVKDWLEERGMKARPW